MQTLAHATLALLALAACYALVLAPAVANVQAALATLALPH